MENEIQPGEIQGIIRRRWRSFLIVFLFIFMIAAFIALILPSSYLSQSKILIESQQIPQEYVKSTITTYVEERLEIITQQVMSRSTLKEIIDQFGLYSDKKARYSSGDIIEMMRDDIKRETISADVIEERTGRESTATIAFTLSYEGKDPATVQKVTNRLASLYMEQNIKSRTEQIGNTITFLEQNIAEIQSQINKIEGKISAFKSAHYGELPESSNINLNTLQNLERQLDQNNAEVMSLRERKIYLEGQLAGINPMNTTVLTSDGKSLLSTEDHLRYLRRELTSLKAIYKDSHPDIVRIQKTIKELESETSLSEDYRETAKQLDELTSQRAVMLEKFTPQHPDVIRLDKEIKALSDELKKADIEKIRESVEIQNPDNPAYINIRSQIQTTEIQIENILKEEKTIKAQIASYQRRLENSPLLEKEYYSLTRDYENAKYEYNEIMSKLMEARVSQGMEETQRGERFIIIDNAELPEKPNGPNRLAIAIIGLFLAAGAGIGVAAFQERMDDSFKTSDELGRFLKVPVLAVMPVIITKEDKRRGTIHWLAMAAGVLSVIILAIVFIHLYVMPIDIVLLKIQRRVMRL